MAKLNLSPPWCIYAQEMAELFRHDDEIHVVFDDSGYVLDLYVDNDEKASALMQLLPEKQEYGNVTLDINVIPANKDFKEIPVDNAFEILFDGNEALSFIRRVSGIFATDIVYVVFVNKVVQYYNDSLSDVYGQCSTLYQTIAYNIFGQRDNIYFCTDTEYEEDAVENGKWP